MIPFINPYSIFYVNHGTTCTLLDKCNITHHIQKKNESTPATVTKNRQNDCAHANSSSSTGEYTPRKRRAQSPPPYTTSPRKASRSFFPEGANSRGPAICAVCLGIFKHDVSKCSSDTFWDGTKARCRRNDKGRIINPAGLILCVDWQRPNGCSASGHNHECSGCGKQDHGAQKCSRAQTN